MKDKLILVSKWIGIALVSALMASLGRYLLEVPTNVGHLKSAFGAVLIWGSVAVMLRGVL